MSRTITNDTLFSMLREYERRLDVIERVLSSSQTYVPIGAVLTFSGPISADANTNPAAQNPAPPGFLHCNGGAVSRATYPRLLEAITIDLTGNITNGSTTISGLTSTADLSVGMPVSGPGIPAGSTIASIVDATSLAISANATATALAAALIFWPHGLGDGSTTFNLPASPAALAAGHRWIIRAS